MSLVSMIPPELPLTEEALKPLCAGISRRIPLMSFAGYRVRLRNFYPGANVAGWRFGLHTHDHYEAHVYLQGAMHYLTDGRQQCLGPGHVNLHAPGTPHAWQAGAAGSLSVCFTFDLTPRLPVLHHADWPVWPDILCDLALLFDDAKRRPTGWEDRVTRRCEVIISRLLTLADWKKSSAADREDERSPIGMIDEFLRTHLHHNLTVDEIADHFGMSSRTLCRKVKEWTGETVMARLLRYRMARATDLLRNTDDSLDVIARLVGIHNATYFCTLYHRYHQITPQHYRRQYQQDARQGLRLRTNFAPDLAQYGGESLANAETHDYAPGFARR